MSIKIQPKECADGTIPYPYFIEEGGMVGRQDFWKGEPKKLIGFNSKPVSGDTHYNLSLEEFFATPQRAVGMYPIFEHEDGKWFTYGGVIQSVDAE